MPVRLPGGNPSTAVANKNVERVASSEPFAKPLVLTTAQLEKFGESLAAIAKRDPSRAAALLERTIALHKDGKVNVHWTVEADNLLRLSGTPWGGRQDAFASMANSVILAIRTADEKVKTPEYLPFASRR